MSTPNQPPVPPTMQLGMGGVDSVEGDVLPIVEPGVSPVPAELPHSDGQFGPMMRREPSVRRERRGNFIPISGSPNPFSQTLAAISHRRLVDRVTGIFAKDPAVTTTKAGLAAAPTEAEIIMMDEDKLRALLKLIVPPWIPPRIKPQ